MEVDVLHREVVGLLRWLLLRAGQLTPVSYHDMLSLLLWMLLPLVLVLVL